MQIDLNAIRKDCALEVLKMYKMANAGHIGASLSCLEILIDLNFRRMAKASDTVILSKGHAACALYVTLSKSGRMGDIDLNSFYKDGTLLAAHPPCSGEIEAIPFGTGSLGHGLSLATGLAFSQKFTGKSFKVFTVLSDGDCNEGSTWEAAIFAGHHNLSQLYVIVDANGLQGFGSTSEILNLEPFTNKWSEFGFSVVTAENGNNFESIDNAFKKLEALNTNKPKCIIARTTKGNGVSYMQGAMEWHYLPMTDDQFAQALIETEKVRA